MQKMDTLTGCRIPATVGAMPNYDDALVRVLEAAGGPSKVAEYLGLVPSAVTQWTRVPARHIHRLEKLTGIPAQDIRPDLWETEAAG